MEKMVRKAWWGPERGLLILLGVCTLFFWAGVVGATTTPGPGSIDINRATVEELQTLPFIGEVRARAIVEFRREHGPFSSLDQLLKSEAVGPRTLEAIRSYLRLGGTAPTARGGDGGAGAGVDGGVVAPEDQEAATSLMVRRMVVTRPGQLQLLCDQEYYPMLLNFLQGAGRKVQVAMFVFRATGAKGNRPTVVADELIAAARRGVEVTVLLENSAYEEDLNREHQKLARTLRQGGVTVRFGPERTTTHTKIILVDDRFVLLGSHNLTHSALRFNHECSLLIDSRELAAQLSSYLKDIR